VGEAAADAKAGAGAGGAGRRAWHIKLGRTTRWLFGRRDDEKGSGDGSGVGNGAAGCGGWKRYRLIFPLVG
jgi:hypothetical protein